MNTHTKKLWQTYAATLLLMTAGFVVLYSAYLFGQYLYSFRDIGSDTTYYSIPYILFDIKAFFSGGTGTYTLQRGLGEYYVSSLFSYLNLVNTPLLLFGEHHLRTALLLTLYLKFAVICLFSLLFFRRLLHNDRLAMGCALLWCFSGYLMLWGQFYTFLTGMVFFTVVMYGLQLFLENDRKRFLLIPALASLACTSYYFLYMACFLILVYSVLYLAFHGAKVTDILKKAGIFALSLILAVGIAGEYMLPAISGFFSSARTGAVTSGLSFGFCSAREILSFAARLLSNNMLGTANVFTGPLNYYELPILSVSVLFFFALVLMLQSKHWKRYAIITPLCALAICLTPVNQIFTSMRWHFLLGFAQVILIGVAGRHLFTHFREPEFRKVILRTVLIADAVCLALIGLLLLTQETFQFEINLRAVLIICVFLALYSVFFLLLPLWKARYSAAVLVVLMMAELVCANYDTIHGRNSPTKTQWQQEMYFDGTQEAVAWLESQDASLYRVNKTYDSVFYNDPMVQGYRGMSIYCNVNSPYLVNLYTSFGYQLLNGASHYIRFSGYDNIANTLLGGKYVIAKPEDILNSAFYTPVLSTDNYVVYENRYSLGFGYLYQEEIDSGDYAALDAEQREEALTLAYYRTDDAPGGEALPIGETALDTSTLDLLPLLSQSENCSAEFSGGVLTVLGTGDDMQLGFDALDLPEGWAASQLSLTFSASDDSYVQIFVDPDGSGYTAQRCVVRNYSAGTQTITFSLDQFSQISSLRLDPSAVSQEVEITSLELCLTNQAQLQDRFTALRQNASTDFTQTGNTFSGTITNDTGAEAMLCVPLVYSDHWAANVDGESCGIVNINGGLVGIPLAPGHHEITITYVDSSLQIGRAISAVCLAAYVIGAIIWWRRKGRKEPHYDLFVPGK